MIVDCCCTMKTKPTLAFAVILVVMAVFQACNPGSGKEERNKNAIVIGNDELMNKGNLDHADLLFSPDYPGGGSAYMKDYVHAIRKAFPDLQVKIGPIVANGDMVAWQRTNTGTQMGDFMSHPATGKKTVWREMVFSRFTEDGKVIEESFVTDMAEVLDASADLNGVYAYVAPLKGKAILRNGYFTYLFGDAAGAGPMLGMSGMYVFSGDTVRGVITHSTDRASVGAAHVWRPKSWSGDTLTYEIFNANGKIAGGGRAVRLAR
jgi:predicted ester cyclase